MPFIDESSHTCKLPRIVHWNSNTVSLASTSVKKRIGTQWYCQKCKAIYELRLNEGVVFWINLDKKYR